MNAPVQVAVATLEGLVFAQALQPVLAQAGPAGAYAAETFADLLARNIERADG